MQNGFRPKMKIGQKKAQRTNLSVDDPLVGATRAAVEKAVALNTRLRVHNPAIRRIKVKYARKL
jgi:hypothetical protein